MVEFERKRSINNEGGLLIKQILWKIFFEDWTLKLIALAITLTLWLGVTGLSTPTTTRMTNVPLTLRFAGNTEITNSPIQEVDIIITGDKRRINQINKNDLILSIDLTDVPPGDRVIQLTPESVSLELPTGVKLDEIQPNRIAIKLEPVEEKEVNVKIETDGVLPEGFEIYSMTAIPSRVRVRGPAGVVRPLTEVFTQKIEIGGHQSDLVSKQVPLVIDTQKTLLLDTTIDVVVRIGEKRVERLFVIKSDDVHSRRATVLLYGPQSVLNKASSEDLGLQIKEGAELTDSSQLILPPQLQKDVEIRKFQLSQH